MRHFEFEYGEGIMGVNLPDTTDVLTPGVTVDDPPRISEKELEVVYKESPNHLIGMLATKGLVHKGSKIASIVPDRVKGGEQTTSHRKLTIKYILQDLYEVDVEHKDILIIISNGLHPRSTGKDTPALLGLEPYNQSWHSGQVISHDSEDKGHMVNLSPIDREDPAAMNKYVSDVDLPILIGYIQGNPYGGHSGGYKHSATGISSWRSIASHHVLAVMHKDDFVPVNNAGLMRDKLDGISMKMEEGMGHPPFCCDAVLDPKSHQVAVFSGYVKEMMSESWKATDTRTYVHWVERKYGVLVFGMPQRFHYGDRMGTNPIMVMQALPAQVLRFKHVMSDNCVIICSSLCNGSFNNDRWPYLRECYDWFQRNEMNRLPDTDHLGEYSMTNEEYIRKYCFANASHPFRGFSMMSCGHITEMNTSVIYIVGAKEPEYARGMGLRTRATFGEALEDAKRKYIGDNPNILALPPTSKTPAMHLGMKSPEQDGMDVYGH